MPDMGRRSYDTGASAAVQSNVRHIASRLETLIDQRTTDKGIALSDLSAEDVSEDYSGKEERWLKAAMETMSIVNLLRRTMGENDRTAADTMAKARSAVADIS